MRRSKFVLLALSACLVLGTSGPAAGAQKHNAPPGTSGVDEYLESVPDGTGNTPASSGDPKHAPVSGRTRKELSRYGSAGQAVLSLAAAGPSDKPTKKSGKTKGAQTEPDDHPAAGTSRSVDAPDGRSPLSSLAGTVSGGDGVGAAVPLSLAIILVGGLAFALRRRSSPSAASGDE